MNVRRKLCVVLDENDRTKALVALSLAGKGLGMGFHTWLLLVGQGVRSEELHAPEFPIRTVLAAFLEEGGELRACAGDGALPARVPSLAKSLDPEAFGRLLKESEEVFL